MNTNPLTDQTRREIDSALRKLADAGQLIRRCERCGLSMEEAESDRKYMEEVLTKMKSEFFGPVNPQQP